MAKKSLQNLARKNWKINCRISHWSVFELLWPKSARKIWTVDNNIHVFSTKLFIYFIYYVQLSAICTILYYPSKHGPESVHHLSEILIQIKRCFTISPRTNPVIIRDNIFLLDVSFFPSANIFRGGPLFFWVTEIYKKNTSLWYGDSENWLISRNYLTWIMNWREYMMFEFWTQKIITKHILISQQQLNSVKKYHSQIKDSLLYLGNIVIF